MNLRREQDGPAGGTGAAPEARTRPSFSFPELVGFVAALMAMNAFAIDMMLAALGEIGRDLGVTHANDRQLVIIVYMFGVGVAQIAYGPLSDRYGRKTVLLGSLAGYLLASLLCIAAGSFTFLLAARLFQGLTAAAGRVIAVALVRDLCAGRQMASVMSAALTVAMISPILAPGFGQVLLLFGPWRIVFIALFVYGTVMAVWTMLRLPETLPPERRMPLNPRAIVHSYGELIRTRTSFGYMFGGIFMFGSLMAYISSGQQIFAESFGLGVYFPIVFAGGALAVAVAGFTNSRLVRRHGMRKLSHTALMCFTLINGLHLLIVLSIGESLPLFVGFMVPAFFTFGLIGPNFNAIAMEPLGHVAGTASALFGFATTTLAALVGGMIGRAYDGTAVPLVAGFFLCGLAALTAVWITERGKMFGRGLAADQS